MVHHGRAHAWICAVARFACVARFGCAADAVGTEKPIRALGVARAAAVVCVEAPKAQIGRYEENG